MTDQPIAPVILLSGRPRRARPCGRRPSPAAGQPACGIRGRGLRDEPGRRLRLGIVNTGVAYWLFYLLIDEAGAATASVITYVMPVVALLLGVGLLGERLTAGAIAGLILIALGAWLATSRNTPREVLASAGRRRTPRRGPASEGRRRGSSIRSWPRRMTPTRAPSRSRGNARRAPAGNSKGSVARPDGDPGFRIAGGYLMLPEALSRR